VWISRNRRHDHDTLAIKMTRTAPAATRASSCVDERRENGKQSPPW